MVIAIAGSLMGIVGLLFSLFLVAANRWFAVDIDPTIDELENVLPGINCGGCGYPSCALYAEAISQANATLDLCVVGGEETTRAVAEVMGAQVSGEHQERRIAVVFCQGDNPASQFPGVYRGILDCAAAVYSQDVSKRCKYGCVGMGSCVRSCPFDAIHMGASGIPIVDAAKCTACGRCVDACPRNLIELHPANHDVHVYCKNQDSGAIARRICSKACIACQLCVKAAGKDGNADSVRMRGNLAVVTAEPYGAKAEYGAKCPTEAYDRLRNVTTSAANVV